MSILFVMRITITGLTVLATLGMAGQAKAENSEWQLHRDEDNVQVYTRKVGDSPYDQIRTIAIVDGLQLASLVALLKDAIACPRWVDRCASSYIVAELSEQEAYSYTYSNMPFPIRDRDVVSHMRWHQDETTHSITMQAFIREAHSARYQDA